MEYSNLRVLVATGGGVAGDEVVAGVAEVLHRGPGGGLPLEEREQGLPEDAELARDAARLRTLVSLPRQRDAAQELRLHLHEPPLRCLYLLSPPLQGRRALSQEGYMGD